MAINKNSLSADFSPIKPGQTIILAISGGPDSVYLLNQLLKLSPCPTIILAHVNYQLRGWASNNDQTFVEKLGQKFSLKTAILSIKIQSLPGNLEENCRKIRYNFFAELRLKHQATWILTGHNLNDQIETFFLNLSRGSTLSGFSAMAQIDTNRHLFRPLLKISKVEILNFLKINKIAFRKDLSNHDLSFKRNFLRHKIIPLFQKINPNFLFTVGESIQNQQENQQIIQDQINFWLKTHFQTIDNKHSFELDNFLNCSIALQKKILTAIFKRLHQSSITGHQIKEILQTIQKNRAGLSKEFGTQTKLSIVKDPKSSKRLVVIEANLN